MLVCHATLYNIATTLQISFTCVLVDENFIQARGKVPRSCISLVLCDYLPQQTVVAASDLPSVLYVSQYLIDYCYQCPNNQ